MIRKGQEIEVDITNLAYGGKGIAKVDGFTVFVDKGIPGDSALVRIIRKRKNHADARIVRLDLISPDRIEPPCPYFGHCGGCIWRTTGG